jgi:hypothetical protein
MTDSTATPTVRRHATKGRATPAVCLNPQPESSRDSLTSLCRELGPCVYFIRTNDGLIKIGHTTRLDVRKRAFGSGWKHILALTPGTRSDETALHLRFAAHLARGREFYHPTPDLLGYINDLRLQLGVPAL